MTDVDKEKEMQILVGAVQHYGGNRQLVKCCEEAGELIQAICKLFDGPCSGDDIEAVVEEMADVEIMLDQVRMVLAVDPDMEQRWRERKLHRLARQIQTMPDGPCGAVRML